MDLDGRHSLDGLVFKLNEIDWLNGVLGTRMGERKPQSVPRTCIVGVGRNKQWQCVMWLARQYAGANCED